MFNILIYHLDDRAQHTFSKLTEDTRLGGGWLQHVVVLLLGGILTGWIKGLPGTPQSSPKGSAKSCPWRAMTACLHQYRPGAGRLESSFPDKNLGAPVDNKVNTLKKYITRRQRREVISPPLLTGEATSGVLSAAWGSPVQER